MISGPLSYRVFRETGPRSVSRDPGIAVPGSRLTGLRFSMQSRLPSQPGSSALLHTKIKLAPVSRGSSHQPSTGLAR